MSRDSGATPLENLPENHIFRLVHRIDRKDLYDFQSDSYLRRPIDIDAVIRRLRSPEGREETKLWVKTPLAFNRLFIHQLCDCNLGGTVGEGGIAGINAESALEAIRMAVAAYPESLQLDDGAGYLPLHNMCNKYFALTNFRTYQSWHSGCKKIFTFLIEEYPEAASIINGDGKSALALVLGSDSKPVLPAVDKERDDIIMTLLDLDPSVLRVADENGRYPIHVGAHKGSANSSVMKKLIRLFPQGLEKRCGDSPWDHWGGRTPLQSILRCWNGMRDDEKEEKIRMMLKASPVSVSIEDKSILNYDQAMDPAGDALDYAAAIYCSTMRQFDFDSLIESNPTAHEFEEDYGRIAGGFVAAGKEYLESAGGGQLYGTYANPEDCERLFQLTLDICRLLDGSVPFRPLHAFCNGRRCRPWYLGTLDQIIKRYPNQAGERDECGNLPLHLFLQSCMVEKERAMLKGYTANDEEYLVAVKFCFKMILDANPGAAGEADGDGMYPLHLAIQTCNFIGFDDILRPLVDLAPDAALVQNPETNLHPFAQASVGSASNVDNTFLLLRQNPSVIGQLMGAENPEGRLGKKRKIAE